MLYFQIKRGATDYSDKITPTYGRVALPLYAIEVLVGRKLPVGSVLNPNDSLMATSRIKTPSEMRNLKISVLVKTIIDIIRDYNPGVAKRLENDMTEAQLRGYFMIMSDLGEFIDVRVDD